MILKVVNVICTSKKEAVISFLKAVFEKEDMNHSLTEAARLICELYPIKKIYFAKSLGKRMHYLTGYGDETYLPAEKIFLANNIWVFIEATDELKLLDKKQLIYLLKLTVICLAES